MAKSTASRGHLGLLAAVCLVAATARTGHAETPPAAAQLKAYQAALAKDATDKDWKAYLADAERLKAFVNDGPRARLEVARAQLHLGDRAAALAETEGFLELGQTHPILSSPLFEPLAQVIGAKVAANGTAISGARVEFSLADPGLLAEDIDFDPSARRFLVSTIIGKTIVAVGENGAQEVFARAPDGWPMAALKLDRARRRLWVTEVAFNGFKTVAAADWGRSALLEYDLDSGRLMGRIEGPRGASLGDMVLAGNGDPIVSDGEGGGLYRLKGGALRRIDQGQFISPQTPAFCADPDEAFVPDYVRGVARLSLKTGKALWLSGKAHALTGIDGLYCRGRKLFAVQNGALPARVVVFELDRSMSRIVGETVVERATPGLDDPTHGVLVGASFHYIGNSGWSALDEGGQWTTGVQPPAPVIGRIG